MIPIRRCDFGRWYYFTLYPLSDLLGSGVDIENLEARGYAYSGILFLLLSDGRSSSSYVDAIEYNVPERKSSLSLEVKPSSPIILEGLIAQPVRIKGLVQPNPGLGQRVLLRYRTSSERETSWHYITSVETDSEGRFTSKWIPPSRPLADELLVRASWDSSDDYAVATDKIKRRLVK